MLEPSDTPLHLRVITAIARCQLAAQPLIEGGSPRYRRQYAAEAAFKQHFETWKQLPAVWAVLTELMRVMPGDCQHMLEDLLRGINANTDSPITAWQTGNRGLDILHQILFELTFKELDELHHRVRSGVLDYVILRLVAAETQTDTPLAA